MLTQVGQVAPPAARRSGLRRIAGISASLVGTQALTSVLGLVFWTLAARRFATTDVGVAGAAVAMMMLLSSLGSLGLGTLLIARLPLTEQGSRRVLVRTSVAAAGVTSAALAVMVPLAAVHLFGAANLRPLTDSPMILIGFAVGTGLMSVVLVLDQAVLTIGVGALQLERNVLASVVKILALVVLGAAGSTGGMTIFLAWSIGTLASLPLVSWRTRGGRAFQADRRLVDRKALNGLGRMAASHHALNTTLQAALQILPIMVTILLSARENAFFNSAVLVSGFVFALPYAIAISLFASSGGSERDVLSRMKLTLPFSLVVSTLAYLVMFPLASFVLGVFGQSYATEGVEILRVLTLAGLPFVVKDHFVALRRVQGRTTEAVRLLVVFLVIELIAAAIGASVAGSIGLCLAWCGVLFVEAVILGVPLVRAWRSLPAESVSLTLSDLDSQTLDPEDADRPGRSSMDIASSLAIADASSLGGSTSLVAVTGLVTEVQEANAAPEPLDVPTRKPKISLLRTRSPRPRAQHARKRNLFGLLALLMAGGVFVMAVAANGSRLSSPSALYQGLWVLGLIVIVLPAAIRILISSTSSGERTALAIAVPIVLELSRLVLNPTNFGNHDELLHTNTLRQIDETSHLFSLNPLLPVSGFYPGLEVMTDAVHRVTGLSAFVSAWVVLMIARVIIALAIIALVRLITGSSRAAAIASIVYVCNPQFLFFNSQYSYQTLALPLAVFTTYVFAARRRGGRLSLVLPLAGMAGVTFTHHLTAMLLVAAFLVWWLVELMLGRRTIYAAAARAATRASGVGSPGLDDLIARTVRRSAELKGLAVMWVGGALMSLLAALNPGSPIGAYLWSIAANSGSGVTGLAEGQRAKPLFSDSAGSGPAPWEQGLLIAAVLIVGLSLVLALDSLRANTRARNVLGVVMALVALVYPVIPAGHLTVATAEVGDRAAGFVFLGIAVVIGAFLAGRPVRIGWAVIVASFLTVVFLGSVVLGSGPTARQLPGPYLISADARSIDADNLAAAAWLASSIPSGNHVYADRDSGLLAAAVGGQFTVRHLSTGIDASRLLLDPKFTADDISLIERGDLSYLIVDTRLSQGLPHLDVYIETGEFEGRTRTTPVPAAALQKFSTVPGVSLIYDNGSLKIYDLRGLRDAF